MPLSPSQLKSGMLRLVARLYFDLRADSVDPNPPRCTLLGGRLGQADNSVLGETIWRKKRHGSEASHARYVDDARSVNDIGKLCPDRIECALEVDINDTIQCLLGNIGNVCHGAHDA